MSGPLVSVIVPIYKVENYLFRCVDSLVKQTLKEIEIILVDDGSPDHCGTMCDAYAKQDIRIKVIHKLNGGLPSARNAGLDAAKGEYVGFVDSDDWVAPDMFELLYTHAKEIGAEMAVCDYAMVGSTVQDVAGMTAEQDIGKIILNGIKPIACNKIFKADNYFRFYEHLKFAEDRPTVIPFLTRCTKVAYVPKTLYFYYQRESSIADQYSRNACFEFDIQSLRLTIEDCEPKYRKQVVKYCLDVITWTVDNKRRSTCKADMIEFLQELSPKLIRNRYLKNNKTIGGYLTAETIPKVLVYANFGGGAELTPAQVVCRNSWDRYASDLEKVELNEKNCDIVAAPKCVREAFEKGIYDFAGDYFRVRYIYDNGGLAVDNFVKFNLPVGGVRAEQVFFGYKNQKEINGHFFGALPRSAVIGDVLQTYSQDSILNEDFEWSLAERIRSVLAQYGLKWGSSGNTQLLEDNVRLYSLEYLSRCIDPAVGVAQIFDDFHLAAEQHGYVLLEFETAQERFLGGSTASADIKGLQYKISVLTREVNRIKNSRSWRITRPLRILRNLFRRHKYSVAEVQ